MTKITKEEVLKLAHMSNIYVDENDIQSYIKELESVLTYAQGLKVVAAQIKEQKLVCDVNITRPDTVCQTDPELLLSRGPEVEENFFVVPKILKQS